MPYRDPVIRKAKAAEYARQWRKRNPEKSKKATLDCFHRNRVRYCENRKSKKSEIAAYMRSYRKKNKDKMAAYWTVKTALKRGKLLKPACCQRCKALTTKLQAHHHNGYDVEHRLDVVWLCTPCHNLEHPSSVAFWREPQ